MPAQIQKSPMAGRLNASLAKHKNDATEYPSDFGKLPGNIHGGIAQIDQARMGIYKKGDNEGQPFVYLRGVVVEPLKAVDTVSIWDPALVNPITKKKGGVKIVSSQEVTVEGRQFNLTLPLCDTTRDGKTTSYDDNIEIMMNRLRLLAGPDFTNDIDTEEDLKAKLQQLQEAGPYFRFSTTQMDPTPQYPNSRVFENWLSNKRLEDYVPPTASAVADSTPPTKPAATATNGQPPAKAAPKAPAPVVEKEEDVSLAELAQAAGQGDDAAVATLTERALAVGITQDELDDPDSTWDDIVERIEAGGTAEAEEEEKPEEEAPEFEPSVGEVHLLYIPDPKTGKKPKKASEVDIKSVNKKDRTVTVEVVDTTKMLMNIKTKKPQQVSWDDLVQEQ